MQKFELNHLADGTIELVCVESADIPGHEQALQDQFKRIEHTGTTSTEFNSETGEITYRAKFGPRIYKAAPTSPIRPAIEPPKKEAKPEPKPEPKPAAKKK